MNKPLDYYIERLPPYIGKEIFAFLIPNISTIAFRNYCKSQSSSYNPMYDFGFTPLNISNEKSSPIQNKDGLYLSRISKKNGKHRYYITKEIVDTIEVEHYDRMYSLFYYDYSSTYVGKNLGYALIDLLLN